MNSAEEIARYKESADSYYSPTLSKRLLGYGYELPPEKSPRKDKKWSLSSLFRKKKKEETESSSEEDSQKKGFLGRKKKKQPDKKKKLTKLVGTFDHVVISRNSHLYSNGLNNGHEDSALFSDPSGGFNGYTGRSVATSTQTTPPKNEVSRSRDSLSSVAKKTRRVLTKARAEARRVNLKHDTSSDEDSQRSASSSRFRSDESLGQLHREGSVNRRSRAARTERYLKRHSKDGEGSKDYLRLSKSDAENAGLQWKTSDDSNRSLSRSPLAATRHNKPASVSQSTSISGLSTIPPSHGSYSRIRVSNSTSNPSYKPPLSMNEYNYTTRKLPNDYLDNQRSVSCDANIHKAPSTEIDPEVIHVQFPIGKPSGNRIRNLSLVEARHVNAALAREPPPPPPRDPRRLVTAQYYENARPTTYYFDASGQMKSKSFNASSQLTPAQLSQLQQTKKFSSFNLHPNCRSTSEDCLPKSNVQLIPRPSSATPESPLTPGQKYLHQRPESFNYLTDKKPRSRKPIFIQTGTIDIDSPDKSGTQKALEFWKQKDREGTFHERLIVNKKPELRSPMRSPMKSPMRSPMRSPQMFTCQTHVQNQVFLPSVLQNDMHTDNLVVGEKLRSASPFKPISPSCRGEDETKRKSSNLEEALDELEAIYNSLRLGDEDLLERAEQREKDAAAKKLKENELFPNWGLNRGALSDSNFSYEPFDSVDSPRRKRFLKKSQTVDRRADDMAYRKMNKERAATINDPQSLVSKVSYLHASPVYGRDASEDVPNKCSNEPDVTLDDVVYRNVKFANSSPRVVEPQPPFGIPLGPITPAANSDYLHAVPDKGHRPTFTPRKIPDLVKDDLAFRNLRKDQAKEPALPPLSPDDLKNNNAFEMKLDLGTLKKRRAVRSLSANIGSLMGKDSEDRKYNNNEAKTLTDIADAMEIARQVLREKENKIGKKVFLSDTDMSNGNADAIAESRMNFLNSLKNPSERALTPERKSPVPVKSRDSSLTDLLTALASEAKETNERELDENLNKHELSKALSEIDAVSEQAKLCEKLLEGVVDSTELMATAPKPTLEEVVQINVEPPVVESVANIVLTRDDSKVKKVEKPCESDHDYENLTSDNELHLEIFSHEEVKCTSPFEEHKAELIASFQELKKNVDFDIVRPRSAEIEEGKDSPEAVKDEAKETVAGEESVGVLDESEASCVKECAYVETNVAANCDIVFSQSDISSSSSSGFYSNSSLAFGQSHLDSLESLKSPKLVLETSKLAKSDGSKRILENQSMICSGDVNKPGTSSEIDRTRRDSEPGHILDDEKPSPAWYRDPTTLAVACSYGFACAHQLASLDFVAILGILFAVLSFIAALIF